MYDKNDTRLSNETTDVLLFGEKIFFTTFYTIVIAIGIPTNIFMLFLTFTNKQIRQNKSNYFIISLLLLNVISGLTYTPFHLFSIHLQDAGESSDEDVLQICAVFIRIGYVMNLLVFYMLVGLSLERCIAVCRPFFYQKFVSHTTTISLHIVFIIIASSAIMPTIFIPDAVIRYRKLPGIACGLRTETFNPYFVGYLLFVSGIIPGTIVIVCNIIVFKIANSTRTFDLSKINRTQSNVEKDYNKRNKNQLPSTASNSRSTTPSNTNNVQYKIAVSTLSLIVLYIVPWVTFSIPRVLAHLNTTINSKIYVYSLIPYSTLLCIIPIAIMYTRPTFQKAYKMVSTRGRTATNNTFSK